MCCCQISTSTLLGPSTDLSLVRPREHVRSIVICSTDHDIYDINNNSDPHNVVDDTTSTYFVNFRSKFRHDFNHRWLSLSQVEGIARHTTHVKAFHLKGICLRLSPVPLGPGNHGTLDLTMGEIFKEVRAIPILKINHTVHPSRSCMQKQLHLTVNGGM